MGASASWAAERAGFRGGARPRGRLLLRFFLVLVYLSAGVAKLLEQPGWLSMTAHPPLLRILTDPMSGLLDPVFWADHTEWFRWGGFFTIAIELSAPLLLTRYAHHWAIGGLCMHIGITLTMSLGMFGWGMLAFYPWLLAPFILGRPTAADTPPTRPATSRSPPW